MASSTPVAELANVDFSAFTDDAALGQAIGSEMEKKGILYLTNTGVNHHCITDLWGPAGTFFALAPEVKAQYSMAIPPAPGSSGYTKFGQTHSLGDRENENEDALEYDHEAFNYFMFLKDMNWPDDNVAPRFISSYKAFCNSCLQLSWRIMDVLSLYLEKEPNMMRSLLCPSLVEGINGKNMTSGRLNHYGLLYQNANEGIQRFVAHKDHLVFTLLNNTGPGLQIQQGGEWLDVPQTQPDSLLLMCGTVLEKITDNKMQALMHRVVVPPGATEVERRTSTVFFFSPDNQFIMVPLNGATTGADTFLEYNEKVFKGIY